MRKRSNSFIAGPRPTTGIAAVRAELKTINPYGGVNPTGLCYQCAIEAATALTAPGHPPGVVNDQSPDNPRKGPKGKSSPLHKSIGYTLDRGNKIFNWLASGTVPRGAVFVVEMDAEEDDAGVHCWNYVKGPGLHPSIYLIDVSTDVYKEVIRSAHFSEWMTENLHEDMGLFNYASPDELKGPLEIYYWGQLVDPYLSMLSRPAGTAEAPL
jgi:hypothetical protein